MQEIEASIRELLHRNGNIPATEVDVRFDAPTREWIDRLTLPTIDLFLFGIEENTDLRETSFHATRVNGRAERRLPPRRVNLRYMVSALTTEVDDEHRLLWRALVTLMRHPEMPSEFLPEAVQRLELPIVARTAQPDEHANLTDLWGGFGVEPHPAFCYTITVPVDLELTISAPLVLTRTVRFGRGLDGSMEDSYTHIGGIVRTKDGSPMVGARVSRVGSAMDAMITNAEGEFRLLEVPSGSIEVRVVGPDGAEQTVTLAVPSGSYDIVLT